MNSEATEATVASFEQGYQHLRGISESRAAQQRRMLKRFASFCGKPLAQCDGNDFERWLGSMIEDGDLHPNTMRKNANMVRAYFTWAHRAGIVSGDVLMAVRETPSPKGSSSHTLPRPYKAKELAQFRKDLDARYPLLDDFKLGYWTRGASKYKRVANHAHRLQIEAIVGLALYTGLRRREIFDATVDDMHPDNEYIVVKNGKGGKPREVPHSKRSREVVATWLDWREKLLSTAPDEKLPFPLADSEAWLSLAPNQEEWGWLRPMRWKRFEEYMTTVGSYGLHRFRHTCATNWLRAGMKIHILQRYLGHASIQQTLAYAEIVGDDLVREVEKHEDKFDDPLNGEEVT